MRLTASQRASGTDLAIKLLIFGVSHPLPRQLIDSHFLAGFVRDNDRFDNHERCETIRWVDIEMSSCLTMARFIISGIST